MATAAISAQGCVLSKGGVPIAELKTIRGPGETAAQIDVTSHSSAGYFKEYLAGFLDGGEFTIEGNLIVGDAGQVALHADFIARTKSTYVLTLPPAVTATWTFSAIISNFSTSYPYDAEASFTATLKISGQPVLAVGASAGVTACVVTFNAGAATGVPTPWAVGTYDYVYTCLTTETWTKFTATFAAGTCTVYNPTDGSTTSLTSTVISAALTHGAAGSITKFVITQTDPNEVAKVYNVYIVRP